MKFAHLFGSATLAVALSMTGLAARATTVLNLTFAATYYQVAASAGDADFGGTAGSYTVASALGANGLPVWVSGSVVHDLGPGNQIEWWGTTIASGGNPVGHRFDPNVHKTGTGAITVPYNHDMFPPGSTGGNNSTHFETASFTDTITLASAGTLSFSLASDDDSFVFIDGLLVGADSGVHGIGTPVSFTSALLAQGPTTIEVFYADRDRVAAHLDLSAFTFTPKVVPEPATWAMLLVGFAGLGGVLRRRRGLTAA